MAAAQGSQCKLGMASSSPATELYDFLSETVACQEEIHHPDGITGSRDKPGERCRQGVRRISGSIELQPNAVELANLLPRILGSGAVLAETVPTFALVVDRVSKVFTYASCKIARATFRGSAGGPVSLSLDVEALDESVGAAGTFPSLSLNTDSGPYMLYEAALTVGGTTYQFRDFELVIDNMLDTERFLNSQTRVSLPERSRMVQVTLNLPYGDASALYGISSSSVAVVLTMTSGNLSTSFSMAAVRFPRQGPTVPGKEEVMLPLIGEAYKSSGTASLVVVNDGTP